MPQTLKVKPRHFSLFCCSVLMVVAAIPMQLGAQTPETVVAEVNPAIAKQQTDTTEAIVQATAVEPSVAPSVEISTAVAEPATLAVNVAEKKQSASSVAEVSSLSTVSSAQSSTAPQPSSASAVVSSVASETTSSIAVATASAAMAPTSDLATANNEGSSAIDPAAEVINEAPAEPLSLSKFILGREVKPNSSVRLTWNSETAVGGFSEETPILVVNGATPGKTLCLTGAVHGDELNGIEMIRRVIYSIEPANLTGTIIGVPVANIMGFRRNSRYLPDRRDWNRYFPGNTHGSSASRLAHSFFSNIIMHCDALVDIHTGSFHRTNLPQLRADLGDENVAKLAQSFGAIAVLNGRGNPNSLRAAAVRAGIPAVTLEAGEPMAIQSRVVDEGVAAINTLLAKMGMYGKQKRWTRIAPVYYRSVWVRANQSGILFSKATLGQRVREDDVLGTVTDPITNARTTIKSPYNGRIIGMALDQVVLPGFAAYHIGIQTPEAILIEESQLNDGLLEDEEDGDDAGPDPVDEMDEPETGVSKAQDRMADE
ncbi:succinylglutamate desuccinylase/aspartoacylase family protein [Cellvibrio sp. QJXJ]|uniref:succinylglutamate desuccinylase/aspartoacylase family protein n=1 Tax=Cellvibrio sp. QJXJ TaxID=2964606 RepID=UPI0021C36994|nr:M14 family metallopeptidase [Cellvibrio sp. QJXJ]UUA73998.1 succinylglutamate desuccinylase/aspartoacylase family protein [Cellvibrio sp. QJXJ]